MAEAELACTYAALILHDDGLEVNGTNIAKLIKKAGIKVDPFWPKVFAKALKGKNISDLLVGGGDSSSTGQAAPAKEQAPAAEQPRAPEKKEEKKEEVEDVDMGGLFD